MGFTSEILHSDRRGDVEHGSIHKPIHTAVTYTYDSARDIVSRARANSALSADKALEVAVTETRRARRKK